MNRRVAWLLLISSGCIYGAPGRTAADEACRSVCSDAHASCVRGGAARQLGLPGLTYDLCAREQQSCLDGCRNGGGPVAAAAEADGGVVTPGVTWDAAAGKLRCRLQTSWLEVPASWRGLVEVVSPNEVLLRGADAVLSVQSAQGEPPSAVAGWATLHGQLSPLGDSPSLSARGETSSDSYAFSYSVVDGGAPGSFRTAQKTVRRAGGYCRVIAVEKATAEQRSTALIAGFH